MRNFFFGLFLLIPFLAQAQITYTPSFPTDKDTIKVVFDATQGSGGLKSYTTGDVYVHIGLITSNSTTTSDWKYVNPTSAGGSSAWGVNTTETKCTRLTSTTYSYTINGARSFFHVTDTTEIIKQIAFVFRSASPYTGTTYYEGKTSTGGDIFLPLSNPGLNVKISAPVTATTYILAPLDSSVVCTAVSANSTSLKLYIDTTLLNSTTGYTVNYPYSTKTAGLHWIRAVATDGTTTVTDSLPLTVHGAVTTEDLPSGIVDGINYTSSTTVTLCLYAPNKSYVYAFGDFSNWMLTPDYFMKKTSDGLRWWTTITVTPGVEYGFQYLVDGSINIADPYCDKVLDPWNDAYIDTITYPNLKAYPKTKTTNVVGVFQTNQTAYNWTVSSFSKPAKEKLVIYELLVRDFTTKHSFQSLVDTISYLKKLGVNAIEVMPPNEFEGNMSWGYNPDFLFAIDKYYGPKDTFKKFVDVCHQNGIAVIFDMVLNHQFGLSPLVRLYWDATNSRPASNSPWFNTVATHDYSVGYDFNHEATATKAYVDRVTKYWITEYKIDGYRFDLSKGFTQTNTAGNTAQWGVYDQSRVNIWNRISTGIWSVDPSAYVILEHFSNNDEEVALANMGMMLWGKMCYNYEEAAMGYISTSDFSNVSWKSRGFSNANLVGYFESHDEERMMFKILSYGNVSGSYSTKTLSTACDRMKLAGAFFFTVPGPKLFEFAGELGYDTSYARPCYTAGTASSCTDAKAFPWTYYSNSYRYNLYKTWAALIKLKTTYSTFSTTDFQTYFSGSVKRMSLNSDTSATLLGNFDVTSQTVTPYFQFTGTWYDYLSGDSLVVNSTTDQITLGAGEFKIYTSKRLPKPDLSGLVGVEKETPAGVPAKFALAQNYPNPFNPSTKISYQLPEAANVNITVYDILGNQVAQLVNDNMQSGYYTTQFNASNYASGVYIARLRAIASGKVTSQAIKMILTK
jgi:hypothetical protein